MKPVFFPTPASFRAWLSRHNRQRNELWVGFYKRSSGKPSITWPESVDEALCFGWIDGIPADEKRFRAETKAWKFFQAQPPGYRQIKLFWISSAKKPDTRQRRLATLIDYSTPQKRIPRLTPPEKK